MGVFVPRRIPAAWGFVLAGLAVVLLGAAQVAAPLGVEQANALANAASSTTFWSRPLVKELSSSAGQAGGFGESTVHLAELILLTIASLLMGLTVARHVRHRWVAAMAPLATAGVYYQFAPVSGLANIAMLAGVPVYFSLWLCCAYWPTVATRVLGCFLSGIAAAAAALCQPVLAAIPALVWILMTAFAVARDGCRPDRVLVQRLLPAVAGLTISLLLWTRLRGVPFDLRLPPAVSFPPMDLTAWLAAAPWLALVVPAAVRVRQRICAHPIWLSIAIWAAAGAILWPGAIWPVATPLGLLALAGMDEAAILLEQHGIGRRGATALVLAAALLAPAPATALWLDKVRRIPEAALLLGEHQGRAYRIAASTDYGYAWRDTRFLAAHSEHGEILICGGPFHYLLLRETGHGRVSWMEALPERGEDHAWAAFQRTLRDMDPSYVYLDQASRARLLRDTSPLRAWFQERYELFQQSSAGAWYRPIESMRDVSKNFAR